MSTFPSVLTSYTNPTPTSPLNVPSHSGIETAQNGGLSQLEATVGLAGASSTLGTVIGDLRSPASNGGGHVQSANTGGTGQTSFNKGDTFAASSSSVINKVAVGADGTVLKADSTQTSGVTWANIVANKLAVTTSSVLVATQTSSVINVLYATSVVGGTLGTNNAVKFTGEVRNLLLNDPVTLAINYGGAVVASTTFISPSSSLLAGTIEGVIASNGNAASQQSWIKGDFSINSANNGQSAYKVYGFGSGNSSVTSANTQNLLITAQFGNVSHDSILAGIFIAEKMQ